jgi:hypothetical protein
MQKRSTLSMTYHVFCPLICFLVQLGCEGRVGSTAPEEHVNTTTAAPQTLEELPLETALNSEERSEYVQVLSGIYNELVRLGFDLNVPTAEEYGASDPTQDCDRCGRETGFLPAPDLFLNRFVPVELKGLTFGLVSWVIDELGLQETLEEYLSERAPSTPLISYRLSVVRVSIDSMDLNERALATAGEFLESGASDEVSITSVTTGATELGITFDQGFAYLLFVTLVEGETKLTSLPSSPVMIYCHSEVEETIGCTQLMTE